MTGIHQPLLDSPLWFLFTKASNAESVKISWYLHAPVKYLELGMVKQASLGGKAAIC